MKHCLMKMKKTALTLLALSCAAFVSSAQKPVASSVTWDNICAHPAPLPLIGHLQNSNSDLSRPSWWSVGCETMDRDYAHFEKFKQYVPQTGVGYARLQSGWAKTEQKKGKYEFDWLDAHVDGLIELGVHPWMCLCYGNPVYSDHGADLDANLFPDGTIMDAWIKYVKAVAKRYKGKVTMYEVWNEPDHRKALDSYDLYANLFVRTAKAIREIDPEVKICALASTSPSREYIMQAVRGIAERGGTEYMDYISYHAYWPVPEATIYYINKLKRELSAIAPNTRLLQGETGCPAILEYGHALNGFEWDEYRQAKWDLRSMFVHWGMGNPYSVFTMTDLNYGWMIQSFGLIRCNLRGEPVYLRPKFHAVQNVTSLITGDIRPTDAVSVESSCGREIHCVGLEKDGKVIGCTLWFGDRIPDSSLEREEISLKINGLDLVKRNLVYVDMLSGNVHSLRNAFRGYGIAEKGAFCIPSLPLWDCPVVIMDREYVPMDLE